jgi:hypothetical protein
MVALATWDLLARRLTFSWPSKNVSPIRPGGAGADSIDTPRHGCIKWSSRLRTLAGRTEQLGLVADLASMVWPYILPPQEACMDVPSDPLIRCHAVRLLYIRAAWTR